MNKKFTLLILLVAPLLLANCSISQSVQPVPAGNKISKVYVKENTDNFESDFHSKLVSLIRANGIVVQSYQGARPASALYHLEYEVDMEWDLKVYLGKFGCTLYKGSKQIASASYDSKTAGGLNLNKFGPPEEKIKPLIDEMFNK